MKNSNQLPRIRTIGAAIGLAPMIMEAIGPLSRLYRFIKNKISPSRVLYLWRVGSDDLPAGPGTVKEFAAWLSSGESVHDFNADVVVLPPKKGERMVFKVGSPARPAGPKDAASLSKLLREWKKSDDVNSIVWGGAVEVTSIQDPRGGFSVIYNDEKGPVESS